MNEKNYFYIMASECNGDCDNCIVPLEICRDVNGDMSEMGYAS